MNGDLQVQVGHLEAGLQNLEKKKKIEAAVNAGLGPLSLLETSTRSDTEEAIGGNKRSVP